MPPKRPAPEPAAAPASETEAPARKKRSTKLEAAKEKLRKAQDRLLALEMGLPAKQRAANVATEKTVAAREEALRKHESLLAAAKRDIPSAIEAVKQAQAAHDEKARLETATEAPARRSAVIL